MTLIYIWLGFNVLCAARWTYIGFKREGNREGRK